MSWSILCKPSFSSYRGFNCFSQIGYIFVLPNKVSHHVHHLGSGYTARLFADWMSILRCVSLLMHSRDKMPMDNLISKFLPMSFEGVHSNFEEKSFIAALTVFYGWQEKVFYLFGTLVHLDQNENISGYTRARNVKLQLNCPCVVPAESTTGILWKLLQLLQLAMNFLYIPLNPNQKMTLILCTVLPMPACQADGMPWHKPKSRIDMWGWNYTLWGLETGDWGLKSCFSARWLHTHPKKNDYEGHFRVVDRKYKWGDAPSFSCPLKPGWPGCFRKPRTLLRVAPLF